MVFDAVSEVRLFILVFISVYTLVLFAYVITSWVQLPYSLRGVQTFLYDVCEPYLRLFRRLLPSPGGFDFSPIVALIVLGIISSILIRLIDTYA